MNDTKKLTRNSIEYFFLSGRFYNIQDVIQAAGGEGAPMIISGYESNKCNMNYPDWRSLLVQQWHD